MHNAPAWQMVGKVAPRVRPPRVALHGIGPLRFGLCLARFHDHVFELQFQLIEQTLAALRARAVYLALHLRDHQSKVLDQGFRTEHLRAHLDERDLERVIVFGKLIFFGKIIDRHRHDANRPQSPLIRSSDVVISTIKSNLLTCVDINRAITRSTRRRRPPAVNGIAPVDSFQQVTELRRRDRHRAVRCLWPDEAPAFEPLQVQ